MTRSRKLQLLTVISVVIMVGLTACGDDDDEAATPRTTAAPQPAQQRSGVFAQAEGTDIPVYPGSQAQGQAQRQGEETRQTFSVNANAPDISRFYQDRLGADWVPVEAISPGPGPNDPYRATWERDESRLVLLVDRAPREAGDNPPTRYTLVLSG
jgi:hypothetical protein